MGRILGRRYSVSSVAFSKEQLISTYYSVFNEHTFYLSSTQNYCQICVHFQDQLAVRATSDYETSTVFELDEWNGGSSAVNIRIPEISDKFLAQYLQNETGLPQ